MEKPANDTILLDRLEQAIAADAEADARRSLARRWRGRIADLTPREVDVMNLIVAGRSQKHIASELRISIQTVAKHRAKVLEKLAVENDVELVRLALLMQDPQA